MVYVSSHNKSPERWVVTYVGHQLNTQPLMTQVFNLLILPVLAVDFSSSILLSYDCKMATVELDSLCLYSKQGTGRRSRPPSFLVAFVLSMR